VLLFGFISFSNFEADPDFYGHLTVGERILADQAIPQTNDYSYTEPEHEWINQYWLAEIIFAVIFMIGGTPALLIFQWLMGGLIILLLLSLVNKETPGISEFTLFLVLVTSIGLIRFGLSLRPQIFTYLNTVILLQFLASNKIHRKQLIYLPLLFVFWVNVHGAVIAGLGIFLIWATVELLKHLRHAWWFRREFPKLLLLSGLILFATLINPYGIQLHQFLWFANTLDHRFLMEWQALDWTNSSNLFFKLAFPIWLGLVMYQFRKKLYLNHFYTLLTIVTAILAIQHIRHIPFFGIAFPLAVALPLNHLFQNKGEALILFWNQIYHRWEILNPGKQISLGLLVLATVVIGLLPPSGLRLMVNPTYPLAHVKFIQEQGWQGRLLNEYDWGYYLIRELDSRFQIAIDGRYETAYSITKTQAYLDFITNPTHNLAYLDSCKADLALLRSTMTPARIVGTHDDWVLINFNEQAALLAKKTFLERQKPFSSKLPGLVFPEDFLFK